MKGPALRKGNQQPVNPILLIILGITLLIGGVFYTHGYLLKSQAIGQKPKNVKGLTVSNVIAEIHAIKNIPSLRDITVSGGKPEVSLGSTSENRDLPLRDPFEPSQFFERNAAGNGNWHTSGVKAAAPVAVPTPAPEIVWEGVMATSENDRVVMLRYQGKPYTLRLGDQLPGTNFTLAEINQDSVIFQGPKGKLQLRHKTDSFRQ